MRAGPGRGMLEPVRREEEVVIRRALAGLLVGLSGFGLGGCEGDVTGAYRDPGAGVIYELRTDGRAYVTVVDTTVAATYIADADRVVVTSPQGITVLARRDGTLVGPGGLVLRRVDSD